MNGLFTLLGIEAWKPWLTALALPPVPMLLLMLIGGRLVLTRRGLGGSLLLLGAAGIWFAGCTGSAEALSRHVLRPPPPLAAERLRALKTAPKGRTAIVVLGGGLEPLAPEYGAANLQQASMERLRYGLWLGRDTGLPVGFSGGVGWGQPEAVPEARIAARIAAQEFGRPLDWIENASRDTRENAVRTIALLRRAGDVRHVLLVTHGWHMPRAVRAFEAAGGGDFRIEPAPMGLAHGTERTGLAWVPSSKGMVETRAMLRELFGRLVGA